jgi:Tol biopolymer transport system component
VAQPRHGRPGLREVVALWALYGVVAAEVFATYSRLAPHELYHVSGTGREAGAARALVFLNWPVALAAIPMLAVVATDARSRTVSRLAVVAAVLCAAIFWPGMVDQANLDARWANAIAALGVLLAFGLTIAAVRRHGLGPRTRARGDSARLVIAVVLVLVSLPWMVADLGFLIGRWPLLGSIYYSDEWYAPFGRARAHQAVHAGNHHGLVGALFVVTVLLLSRTLPALTPRLRAFVGAYLAVLGFYGAANIVNDFWLEQVVKRGVTNWEFPSLITPRASIPWLILLALAALVYVFVFRQLRPAAPTGTGMAVWTPGSALVIVALLVVGLVHGGSRHSTQLGTADGIAFVEGSHILLTKAGRIVQLTNGDGSDRAPAWSPGRRRIAFQSNRDGNWEIYVANADGSGIRRLTHDSARDGQPGWSPDGRTIVFTRNGDLFAMGADGRDVRLLEDTGEWPTWSRKRDGLATDVPNGDHHYRLAVSSPRQRLLSAGTADDRRPSWSPDGRTLAFECRVGDHWHICTFDRRTNQTRYLTGHASDAFAPAWSPDGKQIAFISDRDGADQLFVMRADGTEVIRLTHGLAERDTPTWARR